MSVLKIFTKVETNRVILVLDHIISPTHQLAFMRGHNILKGVVILHETIHELHWKKLNRVIFKIDFETPTTRLDGLFWSKHCV